MRQLIRLAVVVAVAACSPAPAPTAAAPTAIAATTLPTSSAAPSSPTPSAVTTTGPSAPALGVLHAADLALRLPSAVSRAVVFVAGQSVLLAGGLTPAGTVSRVLRIDIAAGMVGTAGHLAAAVHDAGGALVAGEPVVFGGGNLAPERVVQQFAAGQGAVIGELPRARADLVAIDVGGATLVIGGGTPARLDPAVLTTTDGVHFATAATLVLGVRYPAVAAINGVVVVIGGTDGVHDRAEIQAIDLAGGAVRVIGALPSGLSHASAFVLDGRLFVAGGRTGGVAQDAIWEIDPVTGAVTDAGRLPAPVSDAAVIVIGGIAYLIGGEDSQYLRSIVSIGFG